MQKLSFLIVFISLAFLSKLFGQNLNLTITGNNLAETAIIDSISYKKNHNDYISIKTEIDSIQQRLFKNGFIENELVKISKIQDTIYSALFSLKKKYNTIYIYYKNNEVSKSILNEVSNEISESYFILSINEIENALQYINSKISEQGIPFSTLKLSDIKIKDESNLKATLSISNEVKKRTIDKIIVKGYEKFPKSYLKHYLKIKPTDVFNLATIKERTDLLKDLRFANKIKDPEILFTKDSTALYLYIEKNKSNSFDGFLGFGTNEQTQKIEFNGYLNLELLNNLNYGESISLVYKSDENEQKTFNAKINLPYLIGTPLGTELQLSIFKKDSSFTTVNQIAKLYYQLNSRSKLFLGLNAVQSNNLLSEENSVQSIKDYTSTFYNVRYQYIKRLINNRLFSRNVLLDFETGIGNRKTEGLSEQQFQFFLDAFKIFNLNSKNSVFLRFNGFGLFSDVYLDNELKRFGGINSIRGFEENSLSASLYGLINTEYRYHLTNTIYIHSIIDAAYLENKIINQKQKLYGFGLGFGLLTKSGLLKFNYANGKSENQKFKFSNSQIHLSLTAVF